MFHRSAPRSRRWWVAAPAALALLFGVACGDDDTDTGTGDTVTTTSPGMDDDTTTTEDLGEDFPDDVAEAGEQAQRDLEEALRNANLNSLALAVSQVDLSATLGDEEFTVFAPSDEAFLALSTDDLDQLLDDPAQVIDLLLNHLVVGEQLTDLEAGDSVETEAGRTLQVSETGGTLEIDGAQVTQTEEAGNAVIHVIDQVLFVGAGLE